MEILLIAKYSIILITFIIIYKFAVIEDTSAFGLIPLNTEIRGNIIFGKKFFRRFEISCKKLSIPFNPATIGIFYGIGIVLFAIGYIVCKILFPMNTIALIVALPLVLAPSEVIYMMEERKQTKLEEGLKDFFIQLKGALKVNTDVIEALRRIQDTVLDPFREYTKQMLNEINGGKNPEEALDSFAKRIDIERFTLFINNVRYCHIYGGDIVGLTEKTQEMISGALMQKKKRSKETKSVCMVLYILIAIDIFVYFFFISKNQYYTDIMLKSIMGKGILYMNFICIWGLIFLSKRIKKLDY